VLRPQPGVNQCATSAAIRAGAKGSGACNLYSYVTLVSNPDYLIGAKALARSLNMVKANYPLTVLAVRDMPGLEELEALGCQIVPAPPLALSEPFRQRHTRKEQHARDPFTKGNKPAFHNPRDNFVKLRLWQLEQFERVVFLDADLILLQNIDRLFEFPEFVAAPNLYESLSDFNRMNAGVFVARPDKRTYERMLLQLDTPDRFWRRTDQTFLEHYFPDWHGLPYIYNTLQYVWFNLPVLWVWDRIRVIHYQYEKPWETDNPKAELLKPVIDAWWHVHDHGTLPDHLPKPGQPAREPVHG